MREKMKGDSLNGNSCLEVFCEKSQEKYRKMHKKTSVL